MIDSALRYDCDAEFFVADIYRVLGYVRAVPKSARLIRLVKEIHSCVVRVARPRFIMETGLVNSFSELQERSLHLRRYAGKASHMAIMVGTAGEEVSAEAQRFAERGDSFCQYLVGCAATALARRTLDHASEQLSRQFPGRQIGPALSPGNSGSRLDLQTQLVHRLPVSSIGVAFDADNLMLSPVASVSAIFGIGRFSASIGEAEPCTRCASKACSLRANAFQPSELEAMPWSA